MLLRSNHLSLILNVSFYHRLFQNRIKYHKFDFVCFYYKNYRFYTVVLHRSVLHNSDTHKISLIYQLHVVTNMGGGIDTWQPVPIKVLTMNPAFIKLSIAFIIIYHAAVHML